VQSFAGIGKFIGIFSLPLSGCKGRKWWHKKVWSRLWLRTISYFWNILPRSGL
jgi:hypothetical protein